MGHVSLARGAGARGEWRSGQSDFFCVDGEGDGGLFLAAGVLEVGAEPADDAAAFFFGALVVEGDESAEDFFVGEIGGPAVGVGDGGVEIVVDLFEDGDEALLVDFLFFGGECK